MTRLLCLAHLFPAMFLPLVLVPVTPVIVRHVAAIAALEGLQLQVDTHPVSLDLVRPLETFPTELTSISLEFVRLVDVVHVQLHVLHHQTADVAGCLLLVSSVDVFLQMDSTLENFPTQLAGDRLTVFSVIVVK